MMRNLLLLIPCIVLLLFAEPAGAQTTVTIGSGTSASATYGPFYRSSASSAIYNSTKGILYTQAELAGAGIISGSVIDSIQWSKSSGSVLSNGATATAILYLKDGGTTTDYASGINVLTHFGTGFVPVDTIYFDDGANNIPGANSWVGFNPNWNYTGGSLELYVEWEITPGSGNPTTGSFTWHYTSSTPDSRYMYEHAAVTPTATFTTSVNRGNVQITFTPPPSCAGTPTAGSITGVSSVCPGNTTFLTITGQSAGSGLTYQWESAPTGSGSWSPIPTATNINYTTPPVTQSLDYRVLVTCVTGGGASAYTPTLTVQPARFIPPYSYGFTGFPSDCWSEADGILSSGTVLTGTSSSWAAETWLNATNGSDVLHNNFTGSVDNEWLISPTIDLGSGGNYQLDFDVAFVADGTATPAALGSDDTLAVVVSTDNGVTWDIANVIKLYTASNSLLVNGFEHVTLPLSAYSGLIRIAFYASEGSVNDPEDTDGMIDNFTVQLAPSCPTPAFPVSSNVTGYTADLAWTEAGTATLWEVQHGAIGFAPGSGTSAITSSNPYSLTGLTPLTAYDFYVRAICGPGDTSSWSFVSSFTTTCGNVTLPYVQDFSTYVPGCWLETDGQLTNASVLTGTTSSWVADDWLNNTAVVNDAAKILLSTSSDRDWLISQSIDLGSGTAYQLEFDLAFLASGSATSESLGSDDSLVVLISTDNGITWDKANALYTWTSANSALPNGWTHVILPLGAYSGIVKIGFYGPEGSVNDPESVDAMVDNFSIVQQPSCPQPSFLTVSGATSGSVDIGWTQTGPAALWQVEYGTAGFSQGSGTLIITSANPHTLSGLAASIQYDYYVRTICGPGDTSLWSGPVGFATPPANDSAVNATLLTVGGVCDGINGNGLLAGATVEAGEPSVSCEGSVGNFRSVWYKFIAPASGQVRISNDFTVAAADSLTDSKMALYQVSDSSDFSTYQILTCDDDNGVVGDGYRNIMYATNLVPGTMYYIKMDKWNASEIDGSFCINVEDFTSSMISPNANCGGTAYENNDWYSGGSAWVSVVDDNGLVIANLRSNASTAIGSVASELYQHTGPVRIYGSQPYLDRNYQITVDNQPSVPVDVQFFFSDADYTALAAADPNVSMGSLGATRLPTAVCAAIYDPTGQTPEFLAQTGNGSNNGVRYIIVPTPGFSTFFIHAGNWPLNIDLATISAVNEGPRNRIDWTTSGEDPGDKFILERSADGRTFSAIGEIAARGKASAYSFRDEQPFTGVNHYRLRLADASGSYTYSSIVTATVRAGAGSVFEIYPNPASEQVTVKIYGSTGPGTFITISDLTGKVLLRKNITDVTTELDLRGFAKGMYLIRYTDSDQSQSIRLNKL